MPFNSLVWVAALLLRSRLSPRVREKMTAVQMVKSAHHRPLRTSTPLRQTIMSILIVRPNAKTRERLILWISKRIDQCGITIAALQAELEHDLRQTRYQDASATSGAARARYRNGCDAR